MKKTVVVLMACLSLLAVPNASADELQVMECDVTVGAALLAVWDDQLGTGIGIGGCRLGDAEHTGEADIVQPAGCTIEYDETGDNFADGGVDQGDEVQEGWNLFAFCDAGVVDAHITLRILE